MVSPRKFSRAITKSFVPENHQIWSSYHGILKCNANGKYFFQGRTLEYIWRYSKLKTEFQCDLMHFCRAAKPNLSKHCVIGEYTDTASLNVGWIHRSSHRAPGIVLGSFQTTISAIKVLTPQYWQQNVNFLYTSNTTCVTYNTIA